jgi:hypothetical protein
MLSDKKVSASVASPAGGNDTDKMLVSGVDDRLRGLATFALNALIMSRQKLEGKQVAFDCAS